MAGSATVGALRVVLGLDSAAFTDGLNAAQKHLRGVGKSMQQVGATMATVGAGMTAAITAPLIAAGFAASKAATEAADAMGQVEAALKSMGGASGKTKEQLSALADGLMRNSLYDDDDILRSVTASLLTFGNVAGSEFDRAQRAAVDLATRMKMDLQPATLLVGKALNDPIKGMAALGRAGIQFTAAQKDQIKALVASGQAAKAQGIILTELERQFGGAAAAAQATDPYDKMRDALNTLSESAGGVINRFLIPMTNALAALFDKFNGLSPQMQTFAIAGAAVAAALGPALVVIGAVVSALGTLVTAFAAGGILAGFGAFVVATAPFIAAAAAIAAAIWVFRDDLGPVLKEFGATAVAVLGPAIQQTITAAKAAFTALGPAIMALVNVVGPVLAALGKLFLQAFGPIILTALRVLVTGIGSAFSLIAKALNVVTSLLKGDWAGAWRGAGSFVMEIVRSIGRLIEAVFPGATRAIGQMVTGVTGWLKGKLFDVLEGVIKKVKGVSDAFFKLYDAVVGHSYVPDMVEGVAEWMAKLDAGMVVPARNATDATKSAFQSLRDDVAAIMEGLLSDSERAARDLANKVATIRKGVAAGILTPQQGDAAALAAEYQGATMPEKRDVSFEAAPNLNAMLSDGDKAASARAFAVMDDAAQEFGQSFADVMDRVMHGDIKGLWQDMLSDVLRTGFKDLGASLFKGEGFSGLGSLFKSLFGGFKLPGFKTGGSFKVGGAGGLDSQTVAFRATPGETVDVRRPGQGPWGASTAVQVSVDKSKYFDVAVREVSQPMVMAGMAQATSMSSRAAPARQASLRRLGR